MDFSKFYNNPQFSDLQLLDSSGTTFYLHKLVLDGSFLLSLPLEQIKQLDLTLYLKYKYGVEAKPEINALLEAWKHREAFNDPSYTDKLNRMAASLYTNENQELLYNICLFSVSSRKVIVEKTTIALIKKLTLDQVKAALLSNDPMTLEEVRFFCVWLFFSSSLLSNGKEEENGIDDILDNIPFSLEIMALLHGFSSIDNLKFLHRIMELGLSTVKFNKKYLAETNSVESVSNAYQLMPNTNNEVEEIEDLPALTNEDEQLKPMLKDVKSLLSGLFGGMK
jgi:hypothetical protein